MSTLKVNTVQHNTTGFNNVVQFTDGGGTENGQLARVWVNFNGQGTVAIRADFNVNTISDLGAGAYRLNFSSALTDGNYSAVSSIAPGTSLNPIVATIKGDGNDTMSSTALDVYTWNQNSTTLNDAPVVCVSINR